MFRHAACLENRRAMHARNRSLQLESLENRTLLAADLASLHEPPVSNVIASNAIAVESRPELPWHNATMPEDVNGDGQIDLADSFTIIEELNKHGIGVGPGRLPVPVPDALIEKSGQMPSLDVNGDDHLSPIDAIVVINELRIRQAVAAVSVDDSAGAGSASANGSDDGVELRWWKGNTHSHSFWSDGNSAPEIVSRWYKNNGYNFLVVSDHDIIQNGTKWVVAGEEHDNRVSQAEFDQLDEIFGEDWTVTTKSGDRTFMKLKTLDELREYFDEEGEFVLVAGQETQGRVLREDGTYAYVHHTAINHTISPGINRDPTTIVEALQNAIDVSTAKANATDDSLMMILNHPNMGFAISAEEIASVTEQRFFEIYNGHPGVSMRDALGRNLSQTWDAILKLRLGELNAPPIFTIAADDAHEFSRKEPLLSTHPGHRPSTPGRAWLMVRSATLSPNDIVKAIQNADYYASTGVTLAKLEAGQQKMVIEVEADPGINYRIQFIGHRIVDNQITEEAEILQQTRAASATYEYQGDELYVRAEILSDRAHDGHRVTDWESAWVQPVVLQRQVACSNSDGDLNSDGELTVADIDLLTDNLLRGNPGVDVNGDCVLNRSDRNSLLNDVVKIGSGDSNLDGKFDSRDLILTFQGGKFERPGKNASWTEGDWNGDGIFSSDDLIAALQVNRYEN